MKLATLFTTLILLAAPALAAEKPAVYDKKCSLCHSIGGVGGAKKEVGGALDGTGTRHDEAWHRSYLKDPKSVMPEAKMPKLPLTDDEFEALIAYMVSLK